MFDVEKSFVFFITSRSAWTAGPKVSYVFCVCLFVCLFVCFCVRTYHMCNDASCRITMWSMRFELASYYEQLWGCDIEEQRHATQTQGRLRTKMTEMSSYLWYLQSSPASWFLDIKYQTCFRHRRLWTYWPTEENSNFMLSVSGPQLEE